MSYAKMVIPPFRLRCKRSALWRWLLYYRSTLLPRSLYSLYPAFKEL